MIIHVKQACEFINTDGEKYECFNGFIGTPPEWVVNHPYFRMLSNSGLITSHIDTASVDSSMKKEEEKKTKHNK